MSESIGKVGWCRCRPLTMPPAPAPSKTIETAIGEQYDREDRWEREDRWLPEWFDPNEQLPQRTQTPWEIDRAERVEIAGECVRQGLRGLDVDRAIDLTLFARRVVRWAEEGFLVND